MTVLCNARKVMLAHAAKYALRGPHGVNRLIYMPWTTRGVRGLCARTSTPAPALPWRLLEPFKNPKVDLVSALRDGWKPLEDASFASSLKGAVLLFAVYMTTRVCMSNVLSDLPGTLYTRGGPAAHVECWRSEGRSAVWLHLPPALGSYIPCATNLGFALHHAVGQQVALCLWLAKDRPNKLPAYASHQVGVAGFVLWEEQNSV